MTKSNLSALVDEYNMLKAKMAGLATQEKKLKEALAEVPAGSYEGEYARLTIIDTVRDGDDDVLKAEIKEVVDTYRKTLSKQYLTAHTTKTPVRTHRVSARNGDVE